jgi:hypothetical protein
MQRSKLHPYSITSSARARSIGGTVSPMAPAQADQQVFHLRGCDLYIAPLRAIDRSDQGHRRLDRRPLRNTDTDISLAADNALRGH